MASNLCSRLEAAVHIVGNEESNPHGVFIDLSRRTPQQQHATSRTMYQSQCCKADGTVVPRELIGGIGKTNYTPGFDTKHQNSDRHWQYVFNLAFMRLLSIANYRSVTRMVMWTMGFRILAALREAAASQNKWQANGQKGG